MTDPTSVSDDPPHQLATDRRRFHRLLLRLIAYYLVVGGLIAALAFLAPAALDHLPVGGVDRIAATGQTGEPEFSDALEASRSQEITTTPAFEASRVVGDRFDNARDLFLAMLGTVILMLPVSWVYKFIHVSGDHDHSLDETAFVLPTVVAGIVLVVQHSLALAFSLAGIVAGVQFRRALKDTYDTLFILVAIGVGIAAGVRALDVALVMSIFFNFATVLVCVYGDGLESHHKRMERMRSAERKARKRAEAEGDIESP